MNFTFNYHLQNYQSLIYISVFANSILIKSLVPIITNVNTADFLIP